MKTKPILILAIVVLAGCRRQQVVYVGAERPVVVVEDDAPVWDGHVWITIHHHNHGPGCGHYYHHGAWHTYAEDYVYYEAGYAPYSVYVEFTLGRDCAWDGDRWIVERGHVHGPGCGHFFHHDAWHVYPENHVYTRPEQGHFGTRIEPRGRERTTPTPDRPRQPEPPPPQKPVPPQKPKPPDPPKKPEHPK